MIARWQFESEEEYRKALRDEFAMAALQGILANEETVRQGVRLADKSVANDSLQIYVSLLAYGYADAMLKARDA